MSNVKSQLSQNVKCQILAHSKRQMSNLDRVKMSNVKLSNLDLVIISKSVPSELSSPIQTKTVFHASRSITFAGFRSLWCKTPRSSSATKFPVAIEHSKRRGSRVFSCFRGSLKYSSWPPRNSQNSSDSSPSLISLK